MPECSERDFDDKLFNVACSRARRYTFIIVGKPISYKNGSLKVKRYLNKLENERNYVVDLDAANNSSKETQSKEKNQLSEINNKSENLTNKLMPLKYTLKRRDNHG